jgi:hypothetical protein
MTNIHRLAIPPRLEPVGRVRRHELPELERTWSRRPAFAWGVVLGFYLGCMATAIAAWAWSFTL